MYGEIKKDERTDFINFGKKQLFSKNSTWYVRYNISGIHRD